MEITLQQTIARIRPADAAAMEAPGRILWQSRPAAWVSWRRWASAWRV